MKDLIVMAGGGTGGHLFPGIALAEEFIRRDNRWTVVFVGTKGRLDSTLLPKWGFTLVTIPAAPLRVRGWTRQMRGMVALIRGFFTSIGVLRRLSPCMVIGLGGYASGPVLLAAWWLGVTRVIQEQNVHLGFTNRAAARFSHRVFLSWPEATTSFPAGLLTGNPVRRSVMNGLGMTRRDDGFCIVVLGGSQGAHAINRAVVDALPRFSEIGSGLRIVHQTGMSDYEWVRQAYREQDVPAEVHSFIDDMASVYRNAHLIVCRAGATTLSEICVWGRAAVMIPYPFASDNHQLKNAETIVDAGAGTMILEPNLTGESLAREVILLANHRASLAQMEQRASSLGRPDAAPAIVDECYQVMGLN